MSQETTLEPPSTEATEAADKSAAVPEASTLPPATQPDFDADPEQALPAENPDDGRLVWHYQTTPADNWDYTATQHIVLADLEIDGAARRVLMQAPKNGFFFVLDRETGELLSAEKYSVATWATHVDLETGLWEMTILM